MSLVNETKLEQHLASTKWQSSTD